MVYLLINFILVNSKICYILLIILLPYFNMVVIIDLKLLYKKLRATKIIMLFQKSWFNIIATCNCLIKNQIFTKILIIDFSKLFGLLIYR